MAGKAFRRELEEKTGHDLAWFSNAVAGFRGGVTDVHAHLRDFENMKHAASAARRTAMGLLEVADLLDPRESPAPSGQGFSAIYQVARDDHSFGCASLGYVDRDGCRDQAEEERRLEELASSKGYKVLSWDGDHVLVRLPA